MMQTAVKIELITEASCPNVDAARSLLMNACRVAGLAARWREWDVNDPAMPAHAKGYGSPSILIDEVDLGGARPDNSACCRIYAGGQGVPNLQTLVDAIQRAAHKAQNSSELGTASAGHDPRTE